MPINDKSLLTEMSQPNFVINNGVLCSHNTNYNPVVGAPSLINQSIPSTRFAGADGGTSVREVLRFILTTQGQLYNVITNQILRLPTISNDNFIQVLEGEADGNLLALKSSGDLYNIIYVDDIIQDIKILERVRLILPHHVNSSFCLLLNDDSWWEVEVGTTELNDRRIVGDDLPKWSEIRSVRTGMINSTRGVFVVCSQPYVKLYARQITMVKIEVPLGVSDLIYYLRPDHNGQSAIHLHCLVNQRLYNLKLIDNYFNCDNLRLVRTGHWVLSSNNTYTEFREYTMNEPGLRGVVDCNGSVTMI